MRDENNGGPAFPTPVDQFTQAPGMTLRDYFAAKALQGFCANTPVIESFIRTNGSIKYTEAMATRAYELADAMLTAREAC